MGGTELFPLLIQPHPTPQQQRPLDTGPQSVPQPLWQQQQQQQQLPWSPGAAALPPQPSAPSTGMTDNTGLPDGWWGSWDVGENRYYYYQINTGGTYVIAQWDRPGPPGGPPAPPPPPPPRPPGLVENF